jgi:hypothetical protein
MKIDVDKIDLTDFNVRDCNFAGTACVWVFPKLEGTTWKADNLHLRSSIWEKDSGELISGGLKKFFNWAEKPEIYPAPVDINKNVRFVEKIDGSCLIVSKYKGQLITRTRRAETNMLLNGDELEILKKKYPRAFDFKPYLSDEPIPDTATYSLIFEWVTPSNKIVLDYEDCDMFLTNVVMHHNYSYLSQAQVDMHAEALGIPRPQTFSFKSIEDMLTDVNSWKGKEGVCCYYGNNHQHIRKSKSEWYNIVHTFRGDMSLKNIVDLYLVNGMQSFDEFCTTVMNQYTYEGLNLALGLISQVCDAKKHAEKIVEGMQDFINEQCSSISRKEAAAKIFSSYGTTNRADMVFTLLDKKPLNSKQWKKLIFQKLIAS